MVSFNHRSLMVFEQMSTQEQALLVDCAHALKRAAQSGHLRQQSLLRGRRLGVLCESADQEDASLFQHAASELGALVAHVRPNLSASSSPQDVRHTSRMLERLYDAVECEGMPPALVQLMRDNASIPIFNGLASRAHPIAELADQLGDTLEPIDRRRLIVQAALVQSIG